MTDLLTTHAANQPDKLDELAVVDDRGDGQVRTLTDAEPAVRSNQLAHALHDMIACDPVLAPDQVMATYDCSSMPVMIANSAPWSFALEQQDVASFRPESLFEVRPYDDDVFAHAHAHAHLARCKTPRSTSWLDELPKTGSGTVFRRDLRRPFWEGHTSNV